MSQYLPRLAVAKDHFIWATYQHESAPTFLIATAPLKARVNNGSVTGNRFSLGSLLTRVRSEDGINTEKTLTMMNGQQKRGCRGGEDGIIQG